MTREEVQAILESDPNYQKLFDEFNGDFYCDYRVGNLNFRIFNQVGGVPAIYMLLPENNDVDLNVAHEFSNYAKEILQSEYRRANSNV